MLEIGVLALQGDVAEHTQAIRHASEKTGIEIKLRNVRIADELVGLQGLLIPGGESTTISLLLQKNDALEMIREIPGIFGTCAGLILMAKDVEGQAPGQKGIGVMDVCVDRNAYGSQVDSFESVLEMVEGGPDLSGKLRIPFIRAPKIIRTGKDVRILAKHPTTGEPVIVEQKAQGRFFLGATCHPEMKTSKTHEYFLKELALAIRINSVR